MPRHAGCHPSANPTETITPAKLAVAVRACLELASDRGFSSVGLPAISTGIYGYPAHRAAHIAVAATLDYLRAAEEMNVKRPVSQIIFCCFGEESVRLHQAALAEHGHSH